jgi:hypothetical protein
MNRHFETPHANSTRSCLESRLPGLPAKDRQLMAEHEDLQLLRSVAASDEHDQLQQAGDDDVEG